MTDRDNYRDVERDGRDDVHANDYGADPGPGDDGYKPTPDEYREERAWRK